MSNRAQSLWDATSTSLPILPVIASVPFGVGLAAFITGINPAWEEIVPKHNDVGFALIFPVIACFGAVYVLLAPLRLWYESQTTEARSRALAMFGAGFFVLGLVALASFALFMVWGASLAGFWYWIFTFGWMTNTAAFGMRTALYYLFRNLPAPFTQPNTQAAAQTPPGNVASSAV